MTNKQLEELRTLVDRMQRRMFAASVPSSHRPSKATSKRKLYKSVEQDLATANQLLNPQNKKSHE